MKSPAVLLLGVLLSGCCMLAAAADEANQATADGECGCHGWSFNLLCGADGKYYGSQCTMECAGVKEGDNCAFCRLIRALIPVCGKDGLTYFNPVALKCTGVEKDHDGACKGDGTEDMLTSTVCQKACAPILEPVCGKNNKSYANKCRMECDGVELKHVGRCSNQ